MNIIRVRNAVTMSEIILCLMVILIVAFNSLILLQYATLQSSRPLENFSGKFITPVSISKNDRIIAEGYYDRSVMCNLLDFSIHMTHMQSGDRIVIGKERLLQPPPTNVHPGKSIPVSFEVSRPATMYPGLWQPEYEGKYICVYGLFTSVKYQTVSVPTVEVIE